MTKSKKEFDYEDEQARLQARIRDNRGKFISLDPDGGWAPWLLVAIKAPTNVIYENQCAGTGCDHRLVEGFIIPVSGPSLLAEDGPIRIEALTEVFHQRNGCVWSWTGLKLPPERLERLKHLVANIPYWQCSSSGEDRRLSLQVDLSRTFEIAEGWIPITTVDGPGVLLFQNCD